MIYSGSEIKCVFQQTPKEKKRERITLISVLLLLCTFGQRARPGRFSPNTSQAWLRSLLRLPAPSRPSPCLPGPPSWRL